MTAFDGPGGESWRSEPILPAIKTLDWVAGRRVRAHYPLLLAAVTTGEPATRIYAVGLLRTLPAKDLRPLISEIEAAAGAEAESLAGRLLADLARVIAAA